MRALFIAALLAALTPFSAWADQPDVEIYEPPLLSNLEVALELGVLDRGTTGVGAPLEGYGYDHGGGPVGGLSLRFLHALDGEYFHHGLGLRLLHQAGGSFGLSERVGFAWTEVQTGYAFRTMLPCMSDRSEGRIFQLTGIIGVTVANADAGTGRAPRDDRWNERLLAAEDFDHVAVGGFITTTLDYHIDAFFVGASLGLRELFSTEGGVGARSFVTSAALRTGIDLEL